MVYFRKRLTPEVLGEINEMILKTVTTSENNDDHNTPTGGGNSGTLIVVQPARRLYPFRRMCRF